MIFVVCVFMFLNEIKSFDGYYKTVDLVMMHQDEVKKGAKRITLIENGSGFIDIRYLDNEIFCYSFKSKASLLGKKYAVASIDTNEINYDLITDSYPRFDDWFYFSQVFTNAPDENDMYWYVVENTDDLKLDKNIMSYEYTYNGKSYYLLCSFATE